VCVCAWRLVNFTDLRRQPVSQPVSGRSQQTEIDGALNIGGDGGVGRTACCGWNRSVREIQTDRHREKERERENSATGAGKLGLDKPGSGKVGLVKFCAEAVNSVETLSDPKTSAAYLRPLFGPNCN